MNVTFKQLRAFVAVAETGTFAAAAQQLHVTASALSLLMKELESGIGTRLVERTTRRTELTPAGRDFLPSARKLVEELGRVVEGVREFQASERGVLRVASSPTYSASLVPELLADFGARHPGIRIHIVDALTEQVAWKVASGEADLGIAPERAVPAEVVQAKLFGDALRLVCPADHPLAARETVAWAEALAYPFISLSPDYAMTLRADLAHHSESLTLEPVTYVTFLATALALVKSGRGITAQPAHAGSLVAAYGLVGLPLTEPAVQRRICLIAPREKALSPAAEHFRAFLHEHFGVG